MKKRIFNLTILLVLAVSMWMAPSANAAQSPQMPQAGLLPSFTAPLPMLHTIPDTSFDGNFQGAVSAFSTMASGAIVYLSQTDGTLLCNSPPCLPGYYSTDGAVWVPVDPITLVMKEFQTQVLPTGPMTSVWGYLDAATQIDVAGGPIPSAIPSYIGPVIVAKRGFPTAIKYVNNLETVATTNVLAWKYSTDLTLHWADPLGTLAGGVAETNVCTDKVSLGDFVVNGLKQTYPTFGSDCAANYDGPIPAVVHLHGGEVPPELDGGPDAWFTSNGIKGHGYYSATGAASNEAIYKYPNTQEAANIWFHDHVLGITRLNVYAGMAGAYVILDPDPLKSPPGDLGGLTGAAKIIPLVIQDRMFDMNGQLFFPADTAGGLLWTTNPEHPYWVPEFVGDVIVVNGKAWPFLKVEQGRYRFLFLNGSNARTYELWASDPVTGVKPPMWVIGTDGGYLDTPAQINKLTIMPGERYDVIMDFTLIPLNTNLILQNTGRTPFPKGAPPLGATVGQIMQFQVVAPGTSPDTRIITFDPAAVTGTNPLRPTNPIERFTTGSLTRQLTLNEVMGMPQIGVIDPVTGLPAAYPGGPLEVVLNNTKWSGKRVVKDSAGIIKMKEISGAAPWTPIPDGAAVIPPPGQIWYSELPTEGTTEIWEIVNITADAHPIHLHLVQFQIISRQNFNVNNYVKDYNAAFKDQAPSKGCFDVVANVYYGKGVFQPGCGPPLDYAPSTATGGKWGGNPDVYAVSLKNGKALYIQGNAYPAAAEEAGWKDTVISYPGQVLRLAVRWAPQDASVVGNYFPFSPDGHGYVWHCHIIDHEDNEMMRPTQVQPNLPSGKSRTYIKGEHY